MDTVPSPSACTLTETYTSDTGNSVPDFGQLFYWGVDGTELAWGSPIFMVDDNEVTGARHVMLTPDNGDPIHFATIFEDDISRLVAEWEPQQAGWPSTMDIRVPYYYHYPTVEGSPISPPILMGTQTIHIRSEFPGTVKVHAFTGYNTYCGSNNTKSEANVFLGTSNSLTTRLPPSAYEVADGYYATDEGCEAITVTASGRNFENDGILRFNQWDLWKREMPPATPYTPGILTLKGGRKVAGGLKQVALNINKSPGETAGTPTMLRGMLTKRQDRLDIHGAYQIERVSLVRSTSGGNLAEGPYTCSGEQNLTVTIDRGNNSATFDHLRLTGGESVPSYAKVVRFRIC